eukprot:XP_011679244.1 PREDICTED: 12-oxophytodienoate reductase 1-like [Strongylocentrotus purpuratus]
MKASKLFQNLSLGPYVLQNRIVLPPLTRSRSTQPGNIPNELMATYYQQRAGAGFMVTEGTQIEPRGQGYAWTPGIYSPEQIAGWCKVTEAVHAKGGIIFAQLWHVGRVSHTSLQPDHASPVAPSAIRADSNVKVFIETGPNAGALADPSMPRALSNAEVKELVQLYAQAARNALAAGFDGVEIHCANGYLVNQFISAHSNHREDEYGGSLNNRLRFLREVVEAVAEVVGADRLGVRFAPLFESRYTAERGTRILKAGLADLIAFGRPFIANPDLPDRIANGWPLNAVDASTMYGGTEKGYIDYPAYAD